MEKYRNKIFLFSDIDDTLIESERKISLDKKNYVIAGYKRNGLPHSYIRKGLKEYINIMLDNNVIVIPTTARNMDSYERSIFQKNKKIELAIIDFGATILLKNKIDKEYKKEIKLKYNNLELPLKDMLYKIKKIIKKLNFKDKFKIRILNNFYIVLEFDKHNLDLNANRLIKNKLNKLLRKKENKEYHLFKNDSTFAILPNFLSKRTAVKYLIEKYKPIYSFGAGDNLNDLDFMELTDMLMIPTKSDIYHKIEKSI
jgi:hydroxymethylpyrimidine pyrophosphatase-like HAD family hydrolase